MRRTQYVVDDQKDVGMEGARLIETSVPWLILHARAEATMGITSRPHPTYTTIFSSRRQRAPQRVVKWTPRHGPKRFPDATVSWRAPNVSGGVIGRPQLPGTAPIPATPTLRTASCYTPMQVSEPKEWRRSRLGHLDQGLDLAYPPAEVSLS